MFHATQLQLDHTTYGVSLQSSTVALCHLGKKHSGFENIQ